VPRKGRKEGRKMELTERNKKIFISYFTGSLGLTYFYPYLCAESHRVAGFLGRDTNRVMCWDGLDVIDNVSS